MNATRARPVAVVTGASSGLGVEFAREAAADGYDLVLVARTREPMVALADRLRREHGATAHVIVHDLALPGAGSAVADAVAERGLEVEILIDNAGFGFNGAFVELEPDALTRMMQLNVVTLTDLVRTFLPGMLARKRGRVMLLASTAAFQPGPNMAVYCATKAYVLSLGEALAYETRGTGVTVTTLCPGAVKTNFQNAASIAESSNIMKGATMPASEVARRGYRAMKAGKPVLVTGIANAIGALSGRHLPHAVVVPIAGRLLAK